VTLERNLLKLSDKYNKNVDYLKVV